ncbi:MAG: hypothetical protein SOZ69_08375, partial [Streptococcus sp.]|nr:hypothetical protein [Streptococcus sp.]
SKEIGKNEGREAFLFCTNNYYAGKKTDYQTNKQKKTNINRDVCLQSESPRASSGTFSIS